MPTQTPLRDKVRSSNPPQLEHRQDHISHPNCTGLNSIGVSKTAANTNEQNPDSAVDDDGDDATIANSRPDYRHYHTLASMCLTRL